MIGFILMAHENLGRAAALAGHIAAHDIPVVLHVDRKADAAEFQALQQTLGDNPLIRFAPRMSCEWGTFSLVQATLGAAQIMLEAFPDVGHVGLISGSCLPIKPIPQIRDFLADFPDTDFIESVSAKEDAWIVGGLSSERFTLYSPFSWRRQRWIFDRFVDLQRKLGVNRVLPGGLEPFIGSQWWVLSAGTLRRILDDPDLPTINRFFRWGWIPDETYFQSLARKHARKVISKSLTLARFDPQGKPFIFHDDHLQVLLQSEAMFVRKIWPGSDRLYAALLGPDLAQMQPARPDPSALDRMMRRATNVRGKGRRGLTSQSRYVVKQADHVSARPYFVFDGFQHLIPDFVAALQNDPGIEMHGALFEPDRVEFKGQVSVFAGNLTDSPRLRDYHPQQFLANLIWARRRTPQGMVMRLDRLAPITRHILRDRNAQVFRIPELWLLDALSGTGGDNADFQARLALRRLQQDKLRAYLAWHPRPGADVLSFDVTEFLVSPGAVRDRLSQHIPAASALLDLIDADKIRAHLAAQIAVIEANGPTVTGIAEFEDLKRLVGTL
ncbi:DUF5927 domain-containing protein [Halovulum sp. GXIMD14793]